MPRPEDLPRELYPVAMDDPAYASDTDLDKLSRAQCDLDTAEWELMCLEGYIDEGENNIRPLGHAGRDRWFKVRDDMPKSERRHDPDPDANRQRGRQDRIARARAQQIRALREVDRLERKLGRDRGRDYTPP